MNLPPVTTPCGGTASSEKTHSAPTTDGGATAGGEFWAVEVGGQVVALFRFPHWADRYAKAEWSLSSPLLKLVSITFGHGAGDEDERTPTAPSPAGVMDGSGGVAFEIPLKCGHAVKGVFSPAVHEEILRQDRAYCSVCDSVERIREGVK